LAACDKFDHLLVQFPNVKIDLRRRQLKIKAMQVRQQLAVEKSKG